MPGAVLLGLAAAVAAAGCVPNLRLEDDETGVPSPTSTGSEALSFWLNWDAADPDLDLDLHVINATAGGDLFDFEYDCYYGHRNPDWGPAGPVGDPAHSGEEGFQIETVRIEEPAPGDVTYRIIIHYFGEEAGEAAAKLRVMDEAATFFEEDRVLEQRYDAWEVVEVQWPSKAYTRVDEVYTHSPIAPARRPGP